LKARLVGRLLLVGCLSLGPGCRGLGVATSDAYGWGNRTFAPNPVAQVPYAVGFGLGFVAGLPLCLLSWPLTVLFYPDEDGGEFSLSASTAPSQLLGTGLGTLLGVPFYPLGIPWLPPDPEAEPVGDVQDDGR
jgi:hypothetical protein